MQFQASLGISAGKESSCNAGDPWFNSWDGKIPWRMDRLPTPVFPLLTKIKYSKGLENRVGSSFEYLTLPTKGYFLRYKSFDVTQNFF